MEDVNNNRPVVNIGEIILIIIVFSFLFYLIFPGERVFDYALKEGKNIYLTELFFKNIIKKYPKNTKAKFRLMDIYLKEKRIEDARKVLYLFEEDESKLKEFEAYRIRILLYSIDKNNTEELNEIVDYYSYYVWFLEDSNYLVKEYMDILENLKLYDVIDNTFMKSFKKIKNINYRKNILKMYIEFLLSKNMLSQKINNINNIEDYFLDDDESISYILKAYFQANKPYMARDLSLKLLKYRKII